jgi:broad specificity phosphatase PhoE
MPADLFLVRHATPDWNRTDLRYDIPPGPPLTDQGRNEARSLGAFLAQHNTHRIFASPMDRAHETAAVASGVAQTPVIIAEDLTEWERGEPESAVLERMTRLMAEAAALAADGAPIALVTHGGPIRLLLSHLGVGSAEIDFYRRQFDRDNPLPPAGAWRLIRSATNGAWQANLVFSPVEFRSFSPVTIV